MSLLSLYSDIPTFCFTAGTLSHRLQTNCSDDPYSEKFEEEEVRSEAETVEEEGEVIRTHEKKCLICASRCIQNFPTTLSAAPARWVAPRRWRLFAWHLHAIIPILLRTTHAVFLLAKRSLTRPGPVARPGAGTSAACGPHPRTHRRARYLGRPALF
jgi:hypothetical protein